MNPITYTAIQAMPGEDDASASISPNPPAKYTATPQTPSTYIPPVAPPDSLNLNTTGVKGLWSGWMRKIALPWPDGATYFRMSTLFKFSVGSLAGLQAWEMGFRPTTPSGFTGNGQIEAVPQPDGTMIFHVVPSAAGGWVPSGLVLPTYAEGVVHEVVQDYGYNAALEAFWPISITVDSNPRFFIPPGVVNPAMVQLKWQKSLVVGLQPDANPTGGTFEIEILDCELTCW